MRVSSSPNQEAWLFTLAEEKLSVFTNRIDQELPDMCVLERSNAVAIDFSVADNSKKVASTSTDATPLKIITLLGEYSLSEQLKNSQ